MIPFPFLHSGAFHGLEELGPGSRGMDLVGSCQGDDGFYDWRDMLGEAANRLPDCLATRDVHLRAKWRG